MSLNVVSFSTTSHNHDLDYHRDEDPRRADASNRLSLVPTYLPRHACVWSIIVIVASSLFAAIVLFKRAPAQTFYTPSRQRGKRDQPKRGVPHDVYWLRFGRELPGAT
ncbi:hypothetical protein F4819DRAFT_487282 [Hypoxylon fuscum]|nr:hypothetical protein F4819DRAFT_487282 [Hypoxylon fuscum]